MRIFVLRFLVPIAVILSVGIITGILIASDLVIAREPLKTSDLFAFAGSLFGAFVVLGLALWHDEYKERLARKRDVSGIRASLAIIRVTLSGLELVFRLTKPNDEPGRRRIVEYCELLATVAEEFQRARTGTRIERPLIELHIAVMDRHLREVVNWANSVTNAVTVEEVNALMTENGRQRLLDLMEKVGQLCDEMG